MGKPLHLLRKNVLAILAIGALTFTFQNQVQAQCAPDVTPPVHAWGSNSGTGYASVGNDSIVSLTSDGTPGTNANLIAALAGTQPTFSDNCTPAANLNVSSVVTGPTTNACGADVWVRTWQAVDDNSNTLTITQIFTEMPVVTTTNSFTCLSSAAFDLSTLPHATVTGGSGASTITYSGTGVTAPSTFTPATAGVGMHTITASATDASGCTSTANFVVDVRAGGVPTITGPTVVCENASVDLDVAIAGGNAPYTLGATQSGGSGAATVTVNTGAPGAGANPGAVTVMGTADGTVDVEVTITDGDGCISTATYNMTVNDAPVAGIAATSFTVCDDATINLDGQPTAGSGTYTTHAWTLVPGTGNGTLSATNIEDPVFTATAPGTVDVTYTVTDDQGCVSNTATQTITINPLPTAGPITGPTEVCNDVTVTLNGNPAGGSGTFTGGMSAHTWTATTVSGVTVVITDNNDGTADIEGDNTTATTQTVVVSYTPTDDAGCQAAAAVTYNVDVHPNPTLTDPGAQEVCVGATIPVSFTIAGGSGTYTNIAFNATGDISVAPAGIPNPAAGAVVANVTGTAVGAGVLTATLTDNNGCEAIRTVAVTVNEIPTVTIAAAPNEVCLNEMITIDATPADGDGAYTYAWTVVPVTGNGTLSAANVQDPDFTGTAAGTVDLQLVVTDGNNCMSATATHTVTVNDLPTANVATIPGDVCEGATETVTAAAVGGSGTYTSYAWSVVNAVNTSGSSIAGTGATATFTAGTVTAGVSGTVDVVYTVTDDNGCVSATSAPLTVTINDVPENTPTPAAVTICEGTSTVIDGMPTGGSGTYTIHDWVQTGGTFAGTVTLTPIANNVTVGTSSAAGVQAGTIILGYTVTDDEGCASTQGTATVTVNDNPELEILGTSADDICIGGSGNINGNLTAGTVAGGVHTWTVVGGTEPGGNVVLVNNNDGTATLSVAPAATAGNTVIVEYNFTDAAGCAAVAPVQHTITIRDELSATIAPVAPETCEESGVLVTATPMGGTGTYTHAWSFVSGTGGIGSGDVTFSAPTAAATMVTVDVGTNLTTAETVTVRYTVTEAGGGAGCPDGTEDVTITINPLPIADPGPDPSEVCEGVAINVDGNPTAFDGAVITGHAWAFVSGTGGIGAGNVTIATPGTQTTNVTVSGVGIVAPQTVTLSYTATDDNGCSVTENHSILVRPLPTAVIAATPNEVCLNDMITLDGSSSSAVAPATITTYNWQVTAGPGNGTFADNSLAMPVFTGTVAGAVTIELTITDSNGCTDTETHAVTVHPLPTADIIPDMPDVCGDGSTQLLDGQGASGAGGLVHAWSITAGAALGSISPTNAATTTFTSASTTVGGTVTVEYTVTDANGCETTVTEDITVLPRPEATIAPTPDEVCEGASINLDGTASGGSGAGYIYAWTVASTTGSGAGNFTDGTLEDPQFNATGGPGSVTVELVVTDGDGCVSTAASHTITINDQPTANITPNPAAVCENGSITLNGNPMGGSGTYPALGHVWVISATTGTAAGVITNNGDGTILLSVTGNGTLTMDYTVTDDQGCESVTVQRTVTINPAPTAGPITGGNEVCAGSTLNLNGQPASTRVGAMFTGGASNHDWQITGGTGVANITTNNNDGTIVLTGVSAGTVNLSYTPTDDLGCVAAAPVTLTVTVNAVPTANITGTDEICGDGASTTLLNGNGAAVAPAAIATHAWAITSGGGLITMVGAGNGPTETFQSVSTTIGGIATVSYTVTDDNTPACATTVTFDITVNPRPTASITPTAAVCEGTTVTFNGNPTGGSGTYTTHNWTAVNSGGTATGAITGGAAGNADGTADIAFTGDGTVDVSYTVTDNNGCMSVTVTESITVNDQPTATIAAAPNEVCLNETITIDATPADGTPAYTYAWTIVPGTGNGTLNDATLEDPDFTGTAAGTVDLELVVTDANGCVSTTVTHSVTVNPLPTVSVPAGEPNSVCLNDNIDFDVTLADGSGNYTTLTATQTGGTGTGTVTLNGGTAAAVIAATDPTTIPAAINVVGTVVGTVEVTLTLTDDNGCVDTEIYTIIVHALPTAGPITPNPANVCEGETITLDGNPAGGSGSYDDHNWEITGGTGTATINGAATSITGGAGTVGNNDGTAVLTAIADGTIDVRYQVEDNNGCVSTFSATLTVTVEDLPTITLGANPEVCQGTTSGDLVYTATTNAPDQYTIDFDAAAEAEGFVDITTPAALPASPIAIVIPAAAAVGVYNATITVINSTTTCSSDPATAFTVTINENPVINITGDTALCAGGLADQTTMLMATTISGTPDATGYVWTSLDPAIATVGGTNTNTETITGVSAGSVIITVQNTDANGCVSNLDSQVVVVNPLPDNSIIVGDLPSGCNPPNSNTNVYATVFNAQPNTRYEVTINGTLYTTTNSGATPTNIVFTVSAADALADIGSSPFTVTAINTVTSCSQNLTDDLVITAPNTTPTVPVLTPDDIEICEQEQVTIFATDYSQPAFGFTTVIYDWSASDPGHGIADTVALNNNQITALPADTGVYTYRLTVIADGCPSQEAQVNITVHDLPIVFPQAFDIVCGEPDSLLLTANVQTLKIPAQFQWTGPNGFSSVNPTEVIHSPTVAAHQGTYTLMVTDSVGCTTDGSVTVQITEDITQPIISATSSTVCMNEIVTLNATTYSNPDISTVQYEWSVNGTVLDTTTSPSRTAVAGSANLPAGNYTVRVIVTYGNTTPPTPCDKTSGTFVLTIQNVPAATVTPAVGAISLCEGADLNIAASDAGTTITLYTWNGPNGFTQTSTTNGNLSITGITPAQAGTYILTVSTSAGCSQTYNYTVNVTPTPSQPTITASDADLTTCSGDAITLSAPVYTGTSVLYTWTGTGVPATANNTITVSPTTGTHVYQLVVTVNGCPSMAGSITITVVDNPSYSGAIMPSIANNSCVDGTQDLTLTSNVNVVAGDTYAWTGPNGFTSNVRNPVIDNITSANSGTYTITTTNTAGCQAENSIFLTYRDEPAAPAITATDLTICVGNSTDLMIPVYSGTNVSYAWTSTASPVGSNPGLPAVTNNNVIVVTPDMAGSYTYQAIVTVDGCPSDPSTITIIVVDNPSLVLDPITVNCAVTGTTLDLGTAVNGASTGLTGVSYAWSGPNGFTAVGSNPTINNVSSSDNGVYTLTVTSSDGCSDTESFTVSVTDGVPTVSITASDDTPCTGETVTLTATDFSSDPTLSYAWSANAGSATTRTVNVTAVAGATTYSVTVTRAGTACTSTASIVITGEDAPNITAITTASDITCLDGTTDVLIDADVTGAATYSWSGPNGFFSTDQDPLIANATSANSGPYVLTAMSANNGCTSSQTFTLTITDEPAAPTLTASDLNICLGEQVTLTGTNYNVGTIGSITYNWTGVGLPTQTQSNQITVTPTLPVFPATTQTYTYSVTIDGCISETGSVTISVEDAPLITAITTASDITCLDGTTDVLLEVDAANPNSYSFAWSGPNGFSSTVEDPTITNATSANTGVYTVTATSGNGCTTTLSQNIEITDQPQNPTLGVSDATICLGESVILTGTNYSVGTGTNISYTWTAVPNAGLPANNQFSTLVATPTAVGDYTYQYSVTIDGCTSTIAEVDVNVEDAPTITLAITGDTTCVDGTTDVNLDGLNTGTIATTYSWSGPNGFSANTLSATIVNATSADNGQYTLVSTSANGCETISSANVVITDEPVSPTLTVSDATICDGESITLTGTNYSVPVSGNITYNWAVTAAGGGNGGLPTALNSSTIVATPSGADTYTYTYSVTIEGCQSDVTSIVVVVEEAPTIAPALDATTPAASLLCVDGTTDMILNANSTGTPVVTWAWSGPAGFSSNVADPTISNITSTNSGTYTLVATSANGCMTTQSVNINITDEPTNPTLTASDMTICRGETVTLTGTPYSVATNGSISYNWSVNVNGGLPTNTDASTLVAEPTAAGTYTYVYSVTVDGCQSTDATVTVIVEDAPTIAPSVTGDLTCVDGTTDMQLFANVTPPPAVVTYAWSGPSGFTSNIADPVVSNITSANSGTYTLVATSANGCTTTELIDIDITDEPANPTLGVSDATICLGESVILTGTPYNVSTGGSSGIITYNWSQTANGGLPTADQLSTLVATPTAAGTITYTYSVTIDGCQSADATVTITVQDAPTIDPQIVGNLTCVDGTTDAQLQANSTGTPVITWAWSGPNGFSSSDENPILSNITSANSGTYTLTATSANGCTTTDNVNVNITDEPSNPNLVVSDATICDGESVTLTGTSFNVATNGTIVYNWSVNAGGGLPANDQASTLVATPTGGSGVYTYQYSVTIDGCTSEIALVTVTVEEHPTIDPQLAPGSIITCVDGTTDVTLNANSTSVDPVVTWAWSGPAGFSSNVENPVISNITSANSGTYTLVATTAFGCSTTDFVNVNITDEPAAPTLTVSDATICLGDEITLTGTNYSVGTSGTIQYNWAGDAITSPGPQSSTIVVEPVSLGSLTYTYFITIDGCDSETASVTIFVEDAPVIAPSVTGNLTCVDGTTDMQLFANSTGTPVVSWAWSGPAGFTSIIRDPIISNITSANSGTYSLVATSANGCSTTELIDINITDEPAAPTLTASDETICLGDEITLTGTNYSVGTSGSIQYNWAGNNIVSPGPQSSTIVVEPTSLGNLTYTYNIMIDGCPSAIATVTINVEDAPTVSIAPPTGITCIDGTTDMTLDATITGTPAVTTVWSGPAGFSSNDEDALVSNITSANSGTYTLVSTSANGCQTVSTIDVNITDEPAAPTLTSSDNTICLGDEITLTGTNYGVGVGGTIQYNWAGDAIVSPGQQSSTINVTPVTTGLLTYTYFVTIDGCDSELASVIVNVEDAPIIAPSVTGDLTCVDGTTDMQLFANSTGTPVVTYAWSGPNNFTSNIADPIISNITSANSGTYTLVATSANGCSTTELLDINITDEPADPTLNASDATICLGESVILTGTNYNVASNGTISYNWTGDGLPASTDASTIVVTPTMTGSLVYTYDVTIDGCTSTTASVTISVEEAPVVSIATPPTTQTACVDGTTDVILDATITVTPAVTTVWSGPAGFSSNDEDAVIANATSANSGTYTLMSTSANGCVTITSIDVDITDEPADPAMTASDMTICLGDQVTLTGTNYNVASNGTISYNWTGDGLPASTASSTIVVTPTTVGDQIYTYSVTIDGCPSATASVTINVEDVPTVSIAAPAAAAIQCVDGTTDITLDATITGTPATTTVWSGPNGYSSNAEDAVIPNITAANSGTYTLVSTSANGCETVSNITINITNQPADPTLTASDQTICLGESVTLTGTNYNVGTNGAISYNWTSTPNGGMPASTSSSTIIVTPTAIGTQSYTYNVTIDGCTSTTGTVSITVEEGPTVSIAAPSGTACVDGTTDITLDATITGIAAVTTQWSGPAGYSSNNEDAIISNVTSANSGTYTLVATSANGCVTIETIDVNITDEPAAPNLSATTLNTCAGTAVTLVGTNYSVGVTGTISYNWTSQTIGSGTAVPIANQANFLNVNPTDTTTYTYSVTIDGCTSEVATITVNVEDAPTYTVNDLSIACADGTTDATIFVTNVGGSPVTSWSWTGPNGYTSSSQNATLTNVTSALNGTYTVTATTAHGCSTTQSVTVTITDEPITPTVNADDNVICLGDNVTLTSSTYTGTTVIYSWTATPSTGSGIAAATNSNQIVLTPTAAGTYTYSITATVDGCVSDMSSVIVTVDPLPTVAPSYNTAAMTCTDGTVDLTLFAGGSGGLTWSWTGPAGFTSSSQNPIVPDATTANAGSYTVTAISANGCMTTQTLDVIITDQPTDPTIIADDNAICLGESVVITGTTYAGGLVNYNWTATPTAGSGIFGAINSNQITVTPTAAGTYTYTLIVDVDGCTSNAGTVTVTVESVPTVAPSYNANALLCTNGMSDLTLSAGGIGGAIWIWSGPNGFTSSEQNPIIANATAANAGTYTVTAISANGCGSVTASIVVTITDQPAAPQLISNDNIICLDDNIVLTTTNYTGSNVVYNWSSSDDANSGISNAPNSNQVVITPTASGVYTYFVNVMVDGCTSETVQATVTVEQTITADPDFFNTVTFNSTFTGFVTANDIFDANQATTITVFSDVSNGNLSLNNDGTFSYTPETGFLGTDQFTYILCYASAVNPCACDTATVTLTIDVNRISGIDIPNVITPNGDGVNDQLIIPGIEQDLPCTLPNGCNELKIFNQWGDVVFSAENYENDWEGTYNGQPLPDGTYYYIFRDKTATAGQQEYYYGFITVIR